MDADDDEEIRRNLQRVQRQHKSHQGGAHVEESDIKQLAKKKYLHQTNTVYSFMLRDHKETAQRVTKGACQVREGWVDRRQELSLAQRRRQEREG